MAAFNLQQFIRECGSDTFTMKVVGTAELGYLVDVVDQRDPKNVFKCYIETNAFLPKAPTDELRKRFGYLKKQGGRFNAKTLYKDMRR